MMPKYHLYNKPATPTAPASIPNIPSIPMAMAAPVFSASLSELVMVADGVVMEPVPIEVVESLVIEADWLPESVAAAT